MNPRIISTSESLATKKRKEAKRWSQERKNTRDENLTGKIKCLGVSDQGEVMAVPNTQHSGSRDSLTMQFCC